MKKIMMTIALLSSLFYNAQTIQAENVPPEIIGQYGIAIEANSGEILYEKQAHEQANPASITKIMTAILLDEYAEDGEMIKVSENARIQECSCFVFEEGESISKLDAINALMIVSGNDIAMAIAEHVSGSQEEFGKLMTERAKELGARNTTFTSPSGLTEPNHLTTAYDMAMIAKGAMEHPNVLHALSLGEATITTDRREKTVVNSGRVHSEPFVIGGKTGFTNAAGHTLVEIFEKDEKRVITVVMKSEKNGKYTDLNAMAMYAFEQIHKMDIVNKNDVVASMKVGGERIDLLAKESFSLTYSLEKEKDLDITIDKTKDLNHVKKGEKVGVMKVVYNEKMVKEIPLVASNNVVRVEKDSFNPNLLFIGLFIPFILYGFYIVRFNRRKKQKH